MEYTTGFFCMSRNGKQISLYIWYILFFMYTTCINNEMALLSVFNIYINKGNSSIALFKIHKSIEERQIRVTN